MFYNLKEVYKDCVSSMYNNLEISNDLSNEVTKQIFTITAFFLMFFSSFIYFLKDHLGARIELIVVSFSIIYLIYFVLITSIVSIALGLWSLAAAASYFLEKAKLYNERAEKVKEYRCAHNTDTSEVLPFDYDSNKGIEASELEIELSKWQRILFGASIVFGTITIIILFN